MRGDWRRILIRSRKFSFIFDHFKNLIKRTSASKNNKARITANFHSGLPRYLSLTSLVNELDVVPLKIEIEGLLPSKVLASAGFNCSNSDSFLSKSKATRPRVSF